MSGCLCSIVYEQQPLKTHMLHCLPFIVGITTATTLRLTHLDLSGLTKKKSKIL